MSFSALPVRATFDGFLFDLDGTIVDSTSAIEKHWEAIGNEIGVDPKVILATSHGRRSIDTLKILAPDKANWDYVCRMEGQLPQTHGAAAAAVPGARALLAALAAAGAPWAIVTSATRALAAAWLARLALPAPAHLITAEAVAAGKPDPAGYRLGRACLGLAAAAGGSAAAARVLVLEDAPAGIRAGRAAGCAVLAVLTSHSVEQVRAAGPDWIVRDLESVAVVEAKDGALTLEIRDGLIYPKTEDSSPVSSQEIKQCGGQEVVVDCYESLLGADKLHMSMARRALRLTSKPHMSFGKLCITGPLLQCLALDASSAMSDGIDPWVPPVGDSLPIAIDWLDYPMTDDAQYTSQCHEYMQCRYTSSLQTTLSNVSST